MTSCHFILDNTVVQSGFGKRNRRMIQRWRVVKAAIGLCVLPSTSCFWISWKIQMWRSAQFQIYQSSFQLRLLLKFQQVVEKWTFRMCTIYNRLVPFLVQMQKASSEHNPCSSRTPNKRTEEHWRYLIAHGKLHRAKEKLHVLPESPSSLPNLRLARYVNIADFSPYAQAPSFKIHYCSEIF